MHYHAYTIAYSDIFDGLYPPVHDGKTFLGPPPTMTKSELVQILQVLGEESRLRIMRLILTQQRSVKDIARSTGLAPANVSGHLRILRMAGLLEQQRHGPLRLYRLAPAFRHSLNEGG